MSKDRMRAAAVAQVSEVAHDIPEDRMAGGKRGRTLRLVVRLDADEHRRMARYCEDRHLPVSTWARSILMESIRKA